MRGRRTPRRGKAKAAGLFTLVETHEKYKTAKMANAFAAAGSKRIRGFIRGIRRLRQVNQNERMITGRPFFRLFNDILRIME